MLARFLITVVPSKAVRFHTWPYRRALFHVPRLSDATCRRMRLAVHLFPSMEVWSLYGESYERLFGLSHTPLWSRDLTHHVWCAWSWFVSDRQANQRFWPSCAWRFSALVFYGKALVEKFRYEISLPTCQSQGCRYCLLSAPTTPLVEALGHLYLCSPDSLEAVPNHFARRLVLSKKNVFCNHDVTIFLWGSLAYQVTFQRI